LLGSFSQSSLKVESSIEPRRSRTKNPELNNTKMDKEFLLLVHGLDFFEPASQTSPRRRMRDEV
ncbi:MAG: hypothetical protein KGD60_15840, partial [Candidatus Thorarchaeota archaeon]|nr:hypothetical protein [Candidatus Thorarchaeota archaeon]